jgi:hypothetical protein
MQNEVFQFNADDYGRARDTFFNRYLAGLSQARDQQGPDIIIVDNTNLRIRDFERYADLPHDPDLLEVIAFDCPRNVEEARPLFTRAWDGGHTIPEHRWSARLGIWRENCTDQRNHWIIPLQQFTSPLVVLLIQCRTLSSSTSKTINSQFCFKRTILNNLICKFASK